MKINGKYYCEFCGKDYEYTLLKNGKPNIIFCSQECCDSYNAQDKNKKYVRCKNCDKEFIIKRYMSGKWDRRQFCCSECESEYNKINNPIRISICKHCGESFEQKRRADGNFESGVFCSNECAKEYRKVVPLGFDKCKQCGKIFKQNYYDNGHVKQDAFCSEECKKSYQKQKYYQSITKICKFCGKEFIVTSYNKKNLFCSDECVNNYEKKISKERNDNYITPETKICVMCSIEKPASEFGRDSRNAKKLYCYCKDCVKKRSLEYSKKEKPVLPPDYKKICSICKKFKPASEFYKSSHSFDGLQYTCKDCEKREERKQYNLQRSRQIIEKKCKICGVTFKAARNGTERCPDCRQHSIPETIFIELLKKYNINYETEYRIDDTNIWCDFYLPDYNILIDINPTTTHSTIGKEGIFEAKCKDYHINRRIKANEENYIYISIWDWDKPENLIKAIINKTLRVETQSKPNLIWGKDCLNSLKWGTYDSNIHIIDNNFNEQQMLAEGWLPIYDDGQELIY